MGITLGLSKSLAKDQFIDDYGDMASKGGDEMQALA